MRCLCFARLLLMMSGLSAFSPLHAEAEKALPDLSLAAWQASGEEDGISVYRWSPPDSPLFAFRAVGPVEAPLPKVVQALVDIARRKEWVPNLNEVRVVREVSPVERVEYVRVQTPFVVKNRDFVLDARADYDSSMRRLCFRFHSIDDPLVPRSSDVRGKAYDSSYCMTPLDSGHTNVEYRMLIDPMGAVPKWIVNLFQQDSPLKNIAALRRQVAKADVVEEPVIRRLIASPGMTLEQAIATSKNER